MKITRFLPVFLLLCTPFFLGAQDFLGSWTMPGTTPEGESITNTITFNADGTMTVDFASDGTVDVKSTYTYADGKVSVSDSSSESPCYGKTGVYQVAVNGKSMTATLVSDPCEARRADKMMMTKK